MKRTTIFVPEPLERDLQLYARRENKPVAWVVREALAEYLTMRGPKSTMPSFTGIGHSGRSDIAERHEELLWTEPHGGPSPRPAKQAAAKRRARQRRRR
jgi:hypothetical protein